MELKIGVNDEIYLIQINIFLYHNTDDQHYGNPETPTKKCGKKNG
jgi:hypothetical protein